MKSVTSPGRAGPGPSRRHVSRSGNAASSRSCGAPCRAWYLKARVKIVLAAALVTRHGHRDTAAGAARPDLRLGVFTTRSHASSCGNTAPRVPVARPHRGDGSWAPSPPGPSTSPRPSPAAGPQAAPGPRPSPARVPGRPAGPPGPAAAGRSDSLNISPRARWVVCPLPSGHAGEISSQVHPVTAAGSVAMEVARPDPGRGIGDFPSQLISDYLNICLIQ